MSLDEPTPRELAIITALAGDIIEELKDALEEVTPFIHDKVEFLVDAEIIDPEHAESFLRGALHVALDYALDEEDDDAYEENKDSESDLPDLTEDQKESLKELFFDALKESMESDEEAEIRAY